MELSKLKQFITVAKTENVSTAAKQLYLSQPNVSRTIKSIEDELGVQLFERVKGRLILNQYGRFVLERAERIVEEMNQIKNCVQYFQEENARTSIHIGGLGEVYFEILLPRMFQSLPQYEFSTHTYNDKTQIVKDFQAEKLDMLIHTDRFFGTDGICNVRFITENLCVSVPVNNPLSKKKKLRLEDLQHQEFIISSHSESAVSNSLLLENHIPITSIYRIDRPISGYKFELHNGLIFDTILNKYFGPQSKRRAIVPIDNPGAKYDVYLAYKKENEEKVKPIADWIVAFCRNINTSYT